MRVKELWGGQAHAAEGAKMAARLERAERAIEAERAAVRELQAALRAARQVCQTWLHLHT
jgi:hypothetical protein